MLFVIGGVLEGLATKMSGLIFRIAPSFTFAFLIMFLAVMRWNAWGLLLAPLLPAANLLGGIFNDIPYLAAIYKNDGWQMYLSGVIALLVIAVNIIFYKKFGTKKVMLNIYAVIGLLILDYLLYNEVFKMAYRTMTSGNPFFVGKIPFDAMIYDEEIDDLVLTPVNLCRYVEHIGIYNIFGLAVAFVGVFILRSQGVVNNVVDKLIEDKKNAELDRLDAENFTIKALDETDSEQKEESSDTGDSSEN